MLKVSFRETEKNPSKIITKKGRTTITTLKGVTSVPTFWHYIPKEVSDWVFYQKKVELYEDMANSTLIIFSEGKAKCRQDDFYDPVFGERLSEARAKYDMYRFLCVLCHKLCEYYGKIIYGDGPVVDNTSKGIMGCMKKYEGLCIIEAHHIGQLIASRYNE